MDAWIGKASETQLEEAVRPFQKFPKMLTNLFENIEHLVRAMSNMILNRFCSPPKTKIQKRGVAQMPSTRPRSPRRIHRVYF